VTPPSWSGSTTRRPARSTSTSARSGGPGRRSNEPASSGGKLYGVKVVGYPVEPAGGIPSGTPFELVEILDGQLKTGAEIDSESRANGMTDFKRPEDGSWNPHETASSTG
jgi:hypothetical protein